MKYKGDFKAELMLNQSDIDKINRFSKGLSDAEETQYIYSLFSENEENEEFKQYIRKEFNEYLKNHPDENYHLSYLLDRIHHTIHKNENKKKQTIIKRIYRGYSVAAAVLLIPILIVGSIFFISQNQNKQFLAESPVSSTIYAPLGSRISFFLPDGTKGWLNSGSSLEYQIPFKTNRHVSISGEAWFNVAHDAGHPFEVFAKGSTVKVLGTKFNVSAYNDDNEIEVVLEQGKVIFTTKGLKSEIEMKPSERLIFRNKKIIINKITDAYKYSAWKEGKLVFRGDPMTEVARRIGRWYNVNVVVKDKELKSYVFRGTFQDDSLEEVLRYISMTSPIGYRIIEQKQLADGTIQKRKVILFKKKI